MGPEISNADRVIEFLETPELLGETTWPELLNYLGIDYPAPNSNGKIDMHCVFHEERTASLRLWPDSRRFLCHGCGVEGDMVDFVTSRIVGHAVQRDNPAFFYNSDQYLVETLFEQGVFENIKAAHQSRNPDQLILPIG